MPKRHPQQRNAGIQVTLANEQSRHPVDEDLLVEAAQAVVRDSRFSSASISIAVVDDPTIHQLNRQYLEHDYPTDVLSFVFEEDSDHLEGEVIISSDTAAAEAAERGWATSAEQLLYVIHGMLHLVGYRDKSPEEVNEMRSAEEKYLRRFGFAPATSSSGRQATDDLHFDGPFEQGELAR